MMLYQTETDGVVKDMGSKAVLNTDLASLKKYKEQKAKNQEMRVLKETVARLSNEQIQLWDYVKTLNKEIVDLKATLGQKE